MVRGGVNGITFGAVVVNNTGERGAGAGPGWLLRAGSWGAAIVFHVLFSFWLRCVDFRTEFILIILIIPHFCAFVKLKCDIFDFLAFFVAGWVMRKMGFGDNTHVKMFRDLAIANYGGVVAVS